MPREFRADSHPRTASFQVLRLEEQTRAPSHPFGAIAPQREEALTKREREILSCLAEGQSTAAIATRFSISRTTVRNHVQSILRKLGVHSRLAAVVFAHQRRLI